VVRLYPSIEFINFLGYSADACAMSKNSSIRRLYRLLVGGWVPVVPGVIYITWTTD